jgi:hypothetical protein
MLKIMALLTVSILLSMAVISAIESGHNAEAMKSTNKQQRHKHSLWVGNQVCGDELCPGQPFYKWNQKYRVYKSPYDTYKHQDLLKIKNSK